MQRVKLYKYYREENKITISPIKPPQGTEYTIGYRLIADEGMLLIKGDIIVVCVDVELDNVDGWAEEIAPDYQELIGENDNESID